MTNDITKAKKFIKDFGILQEKNSPKYTYPCPRCGQNSMNDSLYKNALSRKVEVYICDSCGMEEAIIEAFFKEDPKPLTKWSLFLTVDTLATKK